ncbi:MAG: endonuclease/exonuclease/phosphatase family protein [Bacteroidales bacterium]|nr:endonuclease/exonuclease/phosphatase family protein [Bacteroidales bacterium]
MGIFLFLLQSVMFWNVENFFDYRNDSTSVSDREFSSLGERHWTKKRFYTKCNAFAKAVLWIASTEGGLPDVIGLAEVENAFVLRRAVGATALRKAGYKIVHYDSPDPRGIDVALLYRAPAVDLVSSKAIHIDSMRTRDILHARLRARDGPETDFFVCHLPSKYGGETESLRKRGRAVNRLLAAVDSVTGPVVIMGDFNDTPESPAFEELSRRFQALAKPLAAKGLGTIRFDGKWDFIDHFYVSPGLEAEMKPVQVPFLMTPDRTHGGLKPLRTYSGPRYTAGVSDHLPIILIK